MSYLMGLGALASVVPLRTAVQNKASADLATNNSTPMLMTNVIAAPLKMFTLAKPVAKVVDKFVTTQADPVFIKSTPPPQVEVSTTEVPTGMSVNDMMKLVEAQKGESEIPWKWIAAGAVGVGVLMYMKKKKK